jgi:excisionase family DNA binding protein
MSKSSQNLLSQKELAARLRVTPQTVLKYTSEGVIPFIMIGRCKRFDYDRVLSALEKNTQNAG